MSVFGVPTNEQLTKINKLSKRKLTAEEVFTFPAKLAGDMVIPGRYIQLTKELLDVFASDANKGVSLLLDHSWSPDGFFGLGGRPKMAIPYGRTFDSRYEAATEEGETISLMADHYMVRGVELDGIKTDDLIVSIEAGTLFDSSIGFSYGKATCSVCGENYRSSKCDHFAGRTYEIEDDDGVTRKKLCYIKAEPPGFLMENSMVFDGAYPGAGTMSQAGDIVENEKGVYQVVEEMKEVDPLKPIVATYSDRTGIVTMVKKSDHKKIYGLGSYEDENSKGSEKKMDEKMLSMLMAIGFTKDEAEALDMEETKKALETMVEKWDGSLKVMEEAAAQLQVGEEYLGIPMAEITEKFGEGVDGDKLMKLAKEGQEYHKSLSDDAIAMGVRAMGNDFPKETWEKSFESMDAKAIKDIMATWSIQAGEIPVGRASTPNPVSDKKSVIPDEVFKMGV